MATLTELAQQLHDIADQFTQLAEAIVKAHTDFGNQLQQVQGNQKPLATTDIKELAGGGGGSTAHWSSDLEKGENNG